MKLSSVFAILFLLLFQPVSFAQVGKLSASPFVTTVGAKMSLPVQGGNEIILGKTLVSGSQSVTGQVVLNAPATQPITVNMTTNQSTVTITSSVLVAAGQSRSSQFTLSTRRVENLLRATITANILTPYVRTITANLVIVPAQILSLSLDRRRVVGGHPTVGTVTATVTLDLPAPPSGLVLLGNITFDAFRFPADWRVLAGSTTASAPWVSKPVTADVASLIGARINYNDATFNLGRKEVTVTVEPLKLTNIDCPNNMEGGQVKSCSVLFNAPVITDTTINLLSLQSSLLKFGTSPNGGTSSLSLTINAGQRQKSFSIVAPINVSSFGNATIKTTFNNLEVRETVVVRPAT